jgi:two-component system cell cycle sensor histidine kinase/response regulator CckA
MKQAQPHDMGYGDDSQGNYHELQQKVEELTRTNAQLKANLDCYRYLSELTADFIYSLSIASDGSFSVEWINGALQTISGYTKQELQETGGWRSIVREGDLSLLDRQKGELMKGFPSTIEYRIITRNGESRWVRDYAKPVESSDGIVRTVHGAVRDITNEKEAWKFSYDSELKFRILAEESPGMIFINIHGRMRYVNARCCEVLGYTKEQFYDDHFIVQDIIAPEYTSLYARNYARHREGREVGDTEYELVKSDGTRITVLIATKLIPFEGEFGVLGIITDITEIKSMEEEVRRSQKLESIGILAGGIAHDFNNILTGILGNLSMAIASISGDDQLLQALTEAEKASLRGKELTQQLLTFSKGGVPVKKIVNLQATIMDAASFALSGTGIACHWNIDDNLWPCEVDTGQISQVISNVCINAWQASCESDMIEISVSNRAISVDEVKDMQSGSFLEIRIVDHGCGIPSESLSKVFDPYYTTKSNGSGLGLAISYSVIKKHGGTITVNSSHGRGSIFTVFIPALPNATVPARVKESAITVRTGSVLIMDDEELVRTVCRKMIERVGCSAVLTSKGEEAIEAYRQAMENGTRFDVVILDLTIPNGLGGMETIQRLKEIDPDVTAVVSSGYSNDPVMAHYLDYGFKGVIKKPYVISEMHSILQNLVKR